MTTLSIAWLTLSLSGACWSDGHAAEAPTSAAGLGYEGCKLSKPLTMAEVMGKDMGGGREGSRAHPDWDALIAEYAPGDRIYFIDCRKVDPSRIIAGTSLYALVREGVVIARAMHD